MSEVKEKKITYWGTLILEGGIKFDFHEEFESHDEVPDWMVSIGNGESVSDEMLFVREKSSCRNYLIPRQRVLAYSLECS